MSDGTISLMRAVEKFDYGRGNKFSHLRDLGDHEELRPVDPGREAPPRAVRDRARGDVRGRADVRTDEQEVVAQADRPATGSTGCSTTSTRGPARSSGCGPAWTAARR